ncbi:hypothetical protein L1887_47891 [Cichorium endivia]|nr:hypothetical protein L1887_47891 [Cichorium endivia]
MHAEVTAAIYWDLWRLKTVEHDAVVTRLDGRQGDGILCAIGDASEEVFAAVLFVGVAVGFEVEEDAVLVLGAACLGEILGEDVEASGEEDGGPDVVVAVAMGCILEEADDVVVGERIALAGAGEGWAGADEEERRDVAELEGEAGFALAAGLDDGVSFQ